MFTFTYTGTTFTLDVVVISPSGVNYTVHGPNGHDTKTTKQMTIVIKNETEVRFICIKSSHCINTRSSVAAKLTCDVCNKFWFNEEMLVFRPIQTYLFFFKWVIFTVIHVWMNSPC